MKRHVINAKRLSLTVAVAAAVGQLSAPVFAQDDSSLILDEIVVTGLKRDKLLTEIPASVTAVSGDDIFVNKIENLQDLSDSIPNVTITKGVLNTFVNIRGVGSGVNEGFEQSVGMFIDGVYAGRDRQFRSPFLDIGSVEILKGPQGVVLGKNTVAGAVNIVTAKPTEELSGYVSFGFRSEVDEQEAQGAISGTIAEGVRARLAAKWLESDGFIDNTLTGQKERAVEDSVVRLTVEADLTENLLATLKVESAEFDVDGLGIEIFEEGGAAGFLGLAPFFGPQNDSLVNDKVTTNPSFASSEFLLSSGLLTGSPLPNLGAIAATSTDQSQYDNTQSKNSVLSFKYALDNGLTFTSVTGHSYFEVARRFDADFNVLPVLTNTLPHQEFEQLSQEIRLSTPGDQVFDYIVGINYLDSRFESQTIEDLNLAWVGLVSLSGLRYFEQDTEALAVFGQLEWQISESLELIAGLRVTREKKEARTSQVLSQFLQPGVAETDPVTLFIARNVFFADNFNNASIIADGQNVDRSVTDTSPSLSIQYDLGDAGSVYASVAKGFKSGGFNEQVRNLVDNNFEFEDEEAITYEVGSKLVLADGAGRWNSAIFYTKYDDLQVSSFNGFVFDVSNAAEATAYGLETDLTWKFTAGLTAGISVAYLDSSYDEYTNATCPVIANSRCYIDPITGYEYQDVSGDTTAYAPEWSGNAFLDYNASITDSLILSAGLDVNYRGDHSFNDDNDPIDNQDAYAVWNARVAIGSADEAWNIALIGKNLSDERYRTFAGDVPVFDGAHWAMYNEPRTFAVQVTSRF